MTKVKITLFIVLVICMVTVSKIRNTTPTSVQEKQNILDPYVLEPYVKLEGLASAPKAFTFLKADLFHGGPNHQIHFMDNDWHDVGVISVFDASERRYGPPLSVDKLRIELRVTGRIGSTVVVSKTNERTDVVIEFVTRKAAEQWEKTLSGDFGAYTSLSFIPTATNTKSPSRSRMKDVELDGM